jgi:hypothetical protein
MANAASRFNKAKARRSYHHEKTGKYVRQRSRTEKNKKKRREKHLLDHPNDLQAKSV